MLRRTREWLIDRLGLRQVYEVLAKHRVPRGTASGKRAWMYVFGAATLMAFLVQVVTGIALASKYVPAPAHAHDSLLLLNNEVTLGRFLRGVHFYGASAMVVLITLHMARVFLTGSYKFPREMNWLTGVLLLALTMTMAFTGQLLRWDENGVWAVFVGAQFVGRVPLIGESLKQIVLGGDTVGGATLSRFFAVHVVLVPLLILGLIAVHLYLVIRHGVSEPPEAGRRVDPETYRGWYHAEVERSGLPYFPYVTWREVVFSSAVLALVVLLSLVLGPQGPGAAADPTTIALEPKPDWFLLWYYALLAVKPAEIETFTMVYLPLILFAVLLLLPLVRGTGERHPARRPWALGAALTAAVTLATLTRLGVQAHWVMDFEATPLSAAELETTDPMVMQGAAIFHAKGCQVCHAARGRGGQYGPEVEEMWRRLPPSVITARIVSGIGDMPAYRGHITASEMAALMRFFESVETR